MLACLTKPLRMSLVASSALAALFVVNVMAQESVEFSDIVEAAATVTALDKEHRLVTLRGPAGNELTLEAGPEVRNFAQIDVGDIVRLSYEQYYSAERVDPSQAADFSAASAAGAARAAEGEKPGMALGAIHTMIVMIESIGPNGRTATFITPDGELDAIYVQREESRAFARSLKNGDFVQLTVAEAVALVVEPLGD